MNTAPNLQMSWPILFPYVCRTPLSIAFAMTHNIVFARVTIPLRVGQHILRALFFGRHAVWVANHELFKVRRVRVGRHFIGVY